MNEDLWAWLIGLGMILIWVAALCLMLWLLEKLFSKVDKETDDD